MSVCLNKVCLLGYVGKDPEIKHMTDGARLARFTVATNESRKEKGSNEYTTVTEWHRIVVFNEHFLDMAEKCVKKGSLVYVEGQLHVKSWTDKATGKEHTTPQIVIHKFRGDLKVLDKKESNTPPIDNSKYVAREKSDNGNTFSNYQEYEEFTFN